MHRLFQTSIFRIALLYLLLLGVTLAVLLGFIYWSTAGLLERQTDETVQAEIRGLAEQYRDEGLVRLRSEEHTSELQSLMRISYAVFCLKKKTQKEPRNANTR